MSDVRPNEVPKLAHRRNQNGVMCGVIKYTGTCSGCTCDVMQVDKNGVQLGMGCEECGYTGKRRHVMYIPLSKLGGRHATK